MVTDTDAFRPYRTGVELLAAVREVSPEALAWREEPYEFVSDRPALDLLTGGATCREALEAGDGAGGDLAGWIASWVADEEEFRREREGALVYEDRGGHGSRGASP